MLNNATINIKDTLKRKYPALLFHIILIIMFISTTAVSADENDTRKQKPTDCSKIEDNTERLNCYDLMYGLQTDDTSEETIEADISTKTEDTKITPDREISYLTKLWELDSEMPRSTFALMPYKATYLLPISYNSSPNNLSFQDSTSGDEIQELEASFQLSFKTKILQDIFNKDVDLWFGYTQKSFYQLYNRAESAPLRENNYEPEFMLNFKTDFDFLGLNGRMATLALNHQSNGRSRPYSRGWNRIIGTVGFEKDDFTLLLKSWYRIPTSAENDDNPDILNYMGYGEIQTYYFLGNHKFGLMLRNNLKLDNNLGAFQLEWSYPLTERVRHYIQYFNGYGETLLDQDRHVNRISVGFVLSELDW